METDPYKAAKGDSSDYLARQQRWKQKLCYGWWKKPSPILSNIVWRHSWRHNHSSALTRSWACVFQVWAAKNIRISVPVLSFTCATWSKGQSMQTDNWISFFRLRNNSPNLLLSMLDDKASSICQIHFSCVNVLLFTPCRYINWGGGGEGWDTTHTEGTPNKGKFESYNPQVQ